MDVVTRRQVATEMLDFECFRLGSPNKLNGSDHLPIGAEFKLRPDRCPQVEALGSSNDNGGRDGQVEGSTGCPLNSEQMASSPTSSDYLQSAEFLVIPRIFLASLENTRKNLPSPKAIKLC